MIARIWRGATRREDAAEYAAYIERTRPGGVPSVPGNAGAWLLWREVGGRAQFITLSF